MSVQLTTYQISEEYFFELLENTETKEEFLLRLKIFFDRLLKNKFNVVNVPFSRLVLDSIERLNLNINQVRILFFLHNFESAIIEDRNILISESVYFYILKISRNILENILSNKNIIPEKFFKSDKNTPNYIELPELVERKNYLRIYVLKASFDKERKFGKIICKKENGEPTTIILHSPWRQFTEAHHFPKGMILGFFNIKTLENERLLIADKSSLMIVNPDLILDVSDIKSCIGNFYDYVITRLCYTKKPSRAQIVGNAVNYIFDEFLSEELTITDELISEYLNKFKYTLALINCVPKDIFEDVKTHVNSIIENGLINKIKSSGKYSVEPSFISPQFGLSGRIDVLSISNKEIIELKTGKHRDFGVWENDKTQTHLYSLMLIENPEKEQGNILVFYSRDYNNPNRYIKSIYPNSYQTSVVRRNEMIFFDRKLTSFNIDEMYKIAEELSSQNEMKLYEVFRNKLISVMIQKNGNPFDELVKNYVAEYVSFCERERLSEKIEFSGLWNKTEFEKKDEYKIIGPIIFVKYDPENNCAVFSVENNESRFRDGDICIVYNRKKKIHEQQIIRGTIKNIGRNNVSIVLRNKDLIKQFSIEDNSDKPEWIVETDYIDVGSRKSLWACVDFLSAEERMQKIVLGLEKPEFELEEEFSFEKLSKSQNDAVNKSISAKDYLLIQGPPGTGKTTVLVYIIKKILEDPDERILVTAFTNRAVDEIINKLINETDLKDKIIRLGGEYSTEFNGYSVNKLIDTVPEDEIGDFLKSKRIYFSTIATASYNDIFHFLDFTTSIIDEASQITEPDTLSIILRTKRFILIGDEKQLPAVTIQSSGERNVSSILTNNKSLNEIGISRLDLSLFERLVKKNQEMSWDGIVLLDKQFRMNDSLLGFSNLYFYNSKLHSAEANSNERLKINSTDKVVNDLPIEFFNIVGNGERKKNKAEANLVVRLVEEYYKYFVENNLDYSIGVISPFRAQTSLINQELSLKGISIKVDTVERFQGGEKDLIIISFAAYHPSQLSQIQCLIKMDNTIIDRKLNVALTRAKKKLILVGNAKLLSNSPVFKNLIKYFKENGKYTDV